MTMSLRGDLVLSVPWIACSVTTFLLLLRVYKRITAVTVADWALLWGTIAWVRT